jgi:hypothetical protein
MAKQIFLLILCGDMFLSLSCVKSSELTEADARYTVIEREVLRDSGSYKIKPLKSGEQYSFMKITTPMGLTTTYGATLVDGTGKEIQFMSMAQKFFNKQDTDEKFKGESLLKNINEAHLQKLNPADFNCEDGFLIKSEDLFILDLRRGNILYLVQVEGYGNINIAEVRLIVIPKLNELEKIEL